MHQFFGLLAIMTMGVLVGCTTPSDIPKAENGRLDLTHWSWEKQNDLMLAGEWAFHWNKLIPPDADQLQDTSHIAVPSTWLFHSLPNQRLPGSGYATYRLQIQLPPDSVPLSLRINTASTALHLWVNGKSVYQAGKVATSYENEVPSFDPDIIPLPAVSSLDIMIYVSNHHYWKGGMWDAPVLGTSSSMLRHWIWDYALTFFLIGSFIIMALYHLILYTHRRSDPSSLYFSIFCLLIVIRTLSTELYLISSLLPWNWVIRAELLSFYLCVPVFTAFAHAMYPAASLQPLVKVGTVTTALFSITVIVLPPQWSSYTVLPFEAFAIGLSMVGFYKILFTRWYHLDGIVIFLLGFVCVFITLVNDSLYANNIITTFYMAPFGLFMFLFSQSALLSRRFSRLANDLELSNGQLERQNQQIEEKNEALIKLNQEMDVFVYRTSHDLRAPLTSLLGIISLMRHENISPDLSSYLDLQERSIHKLDSFVREILDYSRNARLEVIPQTIDFRRLIEEVYELYNYLPQFNLISKKIAVHQSDPFMGDLKRLEVILNNLISNALRYYNPYQEQPYIQIDIEVSKTEASIHIQDNGLGIAPEHMGRIFDMFYRASSHQEGSGLGLFLVKETIEKMHGTILVHSVANEGTSFAISLPNQLVSSLATVNVK